MINYFVQETLNNDRKSFEKDKSKQNLEIHQERQEIRAENDAITKQKVCTKKFLREILLTSV